MIEISFGKLVLLALVALIVLGPEKLPHAARTAGALMRRVRTGWDSVRAEVERELQVEEIRRQARETAAQAEEEIRRHASETKARADAVRTDINDTLRQLHPSPDAPAPATHGEVAVTTGADKDVPHGGA